MPGEMPMAFVGATADVNVHGFVVSVAWQGASAEKCALCSLRVQEGIEVTVGITGWTRRWG